MSEKRMSTILENAIGPQAGSRMQQRQRIEETIWQAVGGRRDSGVNHSLVFWISGQCLDRPDLLSKVDRLLSNVITRADNPGGYLIGSLKRYILPQCGIEWPDAQQLKVAE